MHMYRYMYKKSNSHLSPKITFAPQSFCALAAGSVSKQKETVGDKLWSPTAKIME